MGRNAANAQARQHRPRRVGTCTGRELPARSVTVGCRADAGDVYEWTTSLFDGYQGYTTFPYPEYSEVFFGADYRVLRGASWATSKWVARNTFRNWDYPIRRQIFAGFRVVWDVD